MIREDATNLRLALIAMAILNAVLLAGLVATAGVLLGMAGSERFSSAVAVRLHLAPRKEARAATKTASGAQNEVSAVRRFVEDGLNHVDERGNDVIELRAVVTDEPRVRVGGFALRKREMAPPGGTSRGLGTGQRQAG